MDALLLKESMVLWMAAGLMLDQVIRSHHRMRLRRALLARLAD